MRCLHCGSELPEGAKFCGACGLSTAPSTNPEQGQQVYVPGSGSPAAAPTAAQPVQQPQAVPTAQPVSAPQTQPLPEQGAYAAQPAQPQAAYTVGQPYAQPQPVVPRVEGCLGAAWHDITSSQGWVKRLLLLMVMKCVPVLGMFTTGYSLQWGADAARGNRAPLPRGTFDKHTFLYGLLYAVLGVLLAIANVWTWTIAIIPFIGFIITLAIGLFASAFLLLAGMRMTLYRAFGEAFELSKLFAAYRGNLGSLFVAACVPGIVVNVAFFLVAFVLVFIMVGVTAATGGYYGGYYGSMGGADVFGVLALAMSVLGVGFFFLLILGAFFNGFAEVWSMRAVGHWVARFAPEWVAEADASGRASEGAAAAEASGAATPQR